MYCLCPHFFPELWPFAALLWLKGPALHSKGGPHNVPPSISHITSINYPGVMMEKQATVTRKHETLMDFPFCPQNSHSPYGISINIVLSGFSYHLRTRLVVLCLSKNQNLNSLNGTSRVVHYAWAPSTRY